MNATNYETNTTMYIPFISKLLRNALYSLETIKSVAQILWIAIDNCTLLLESINFLKT